MALLLLSVATGSRAVDYATRACLEEAMTAREMAQMRDDGVPEHRFHDAIDRMAAEHPELAQSEGGVRLAHADVAEVYATRLGPDDVHAVVLHRCLSRTGT